ncbi:hypothetical protein FWD07_03040 [Candidatus Saccharibacteria bacterium]|nr:hypothetical protein [Candidatus Saccharibacteria bacterium]
MAFIRKVKTGSGATAVQIVYKRYGDVVKILHVGSSHTEEGVKILERQGRRRIAEGEGQVRMFDPREFTEEE